jgi:TM2 domain-containing membrane protein YozV
MALEQNEISNKSRLITLLLSFLLVHRFYVGKVVSGFFFFFTAGGLGIWWIIDVIQILSGSFKDQFNKFVFNWEADKKQLGFTIAALVVVMFIGVSSGNKNKKGESTSNSASLTEASKESSAESKAEDKTYKIGDVLKFDEIEVTVVKQEQKGRVGGQYLSEPASEGATLICIQYKYKNISTKPLSGFRHPKFNLIDASGTEYEEDHGKSIYYNTDIGTDIKVLSKLNPGVTVKNGEVFEISKESWAKGPWALKIDYSGTDYSIKLK